MRKFLTSLLLAIILLSTITSTSFGFSLYGNKTNSNNEIKVVTGLNNSKQNLRLIRKQLYNKTTNTKISLRDLINLIKRISAAYGSVQLGPATLTCSKELAVLSASCASTDNTGPIGIVPAILNNNGIKTDITLITLGGTEFVDGQATNITTDILSGLELNNDYLRAIVKLFKTQDAEGNNIIPLDKPIVVAGISLGGMVAQQLLAQEYITENYKIINIISFGSPIICPNYRTDYTTVRRLCDTIDIVPKLSVTEILDFDTAKLDKIERIDKTGGYKTFIGGHALSYVDAECWNSFDVLGFENGNASLELLEEIKFYDAPLQK